MAMLEIFKPYFYVIKPGIVLGNLVCAAGGFFVASKGRIDGVVLFSAFTGISLVVASGCVFNNLIDRKIDRKMRRTCNRVLATGRLSPRKAVFYGSFLGFCGTLLLWMTSNRLCLVMVLSGFAIYIGLYSVILKRHSVYSVIVGSLAGAAPPLAAYCAVSNRFDTGAVILLLIFSLWQIPHSYAIAIYHREDYAAADIPVLPVNRSILTTKKHITVYMAAFICASLMPVIGGYTGGIYLSAAAVMGVSGLGLAGSGYRASDERIWARKMFIFSILAIAVLSIMMSIDVRVPSGTVALLNLGP
jgi:protoheme IX farnesyltransferase